MDGQQADFVNGSGRHEDNFVRKLTDYLNKKLINTCGARACWGQRFDYASYRFSYSPGNQATHPQNRSYQTDILIYDELNEGDWVPRVVLECKYGSTNTHDLITYGKKAEAHRTLHPYLRYGFVIGGCRGTIPYRMLIHGTAFDFLALVSSDEEETEFAKLRNVLEAEVEASRLLWLAYKDQEVPSGTRLIHRGLTVTGNVASS